MKEIIQSKLNHWYLPLISGILFVILGGWVLAQPISSYVAMSIFFAVLFFVSGVSDTIHAIANRKHLDGWGWMLAFGVLNIIVGIMLISSAELSMLVLATYIGFMMMFRAVSQIAFSIEMKKNEANGWGWILALGILGVLFSMLLIWNPIFAGLTAVFYTAFALFSLGFAQMVIAFRLRKVKKAFEKMD